MVSRWERGVPGASRSPLNAASPCNLLSCPNEGLYVENRNKYDSRPLAFSLSASVVILFLWRMPDQSRRSARVLDERRYPAKCGSTQYFQNYFDPLRTSLVLSSVFKFHSKKSCASYRIVL